MRALFSPPPSEITAPDILPLQMTHTHTHVVYSSLLRHGPSHHVESTAVWCWLLQTLPLQTGNASRQTLTRTARAREALLLTLRTLAVISSTLSHSVMPTPAASRKSSLPFTAFRSFPVALPSPRQPSERVLHREEGHHERVSRNVNVRT